MLNDTQKKILRLLVEFNPRTDYMQMLAEDDDYALTEIENQTPIVLQKKTEIKNSLIHQKDMLDEQLSRINADIELLTGN